MIRSNLYGNQKKRCNERTKGLIDYVLVNKRLKRMVPSDWGEANSSSSLQKEKDATNECSTEG